MTLRNDSAVQADIARSDLDRYFGIFVAPIQMIRCQSRKVSGRCDDFARRRADGAGAICDREFFILTMMCAQEQC